MELRPIFSALCQQPTVPLLVLLQMAVSLAILANALFIADARHALIARPSGILQERDVFYLRLHDVRPLPRAEFQARQQRLQQTLQHLPGVAAVATSNQMPMSHNGLILLVSHTNQTQVAPVRASAYQTDQHFLPTLGLALAGGRNFLASEMPKAGTESNDGPPPVVILTQALARHLYPGVASAVGQTLYLGNGPEARGVRVIGVVTRLQSILSGAESHAEYAPDSPGPCGQSRATGWCCAACPASARGYKRRYWPACVIWPVPPWRYKAAPCCKIGKNTTSATVAWPGCCLASRYCCCWSVPGRLSASAACG